MDDGGHRENGRHRAEQYKAVQSQWLMQHHQPSMKQIMAIMAERDAAIQERNLALAEKKQALAERDMAFVHRDAAIGERNTALLERDNAHATLQYRDNSLSTGNNMQQCPPGCQIAPGVKHMHQAQQHGTGAQQHPPQLTVAVPLYNTKDNDISETLPVSPDASEAAKSRKGKRPKEPKAVTSTKKGQKPPKKAKRESEEELNKSMFGKSHEWMGGGQDTSGGSVSKSNWKSQDLGLNQVCYDESTMPAPVCSCTGNLRQCYKWGNGGWQSSCCTTILSMYPLPAVPNKRHGRVGGRKMSGSAFNKLLSRLASEGHDLSNPVDLNNRWAKHGTNRYITIK